MATTFTFTDNELRAARILLQDCLDNMGGKRPADLANDPFTWCEALTLVKAGFSRHEAAGTYGALIEKGFIVDEGRDSHIADDGWRFMDTIW